jgi:hypothetical protein
MSYKAIDLWLTHGLPSLGLSPLMIYMAYKTTRDAEAWAMKVKAWCGT